jgi:hypothetical protein
MSGFYRRTNPGIRENAGAGLAAFGVAAGAAAVTFYLVRIFLAREPLGPFDPPRLPSPEGLPPKEGDSPPPGVTEG